MLFPFYGLFPQLFLFENDTSNICWGMAVMPLKVGSRAILQIKPSANQLYTTINEYSMPNNVFQIQVKSVEVVWNDSLEKLYFPSGQESLIRRKVKDQLLWGLARKTLTDKNVDFLHWSEEVSCS